jgi:nitrogen fixation/metabolism regulation signal transduction histidine kinase
MAQESQKVTQVVEMTVAEDPDYAELLGGSSSEYRAELSAYQDRMREQQRHYGVVLISGLILFVFGVGLATIALTHRIAGPVFKLKRDLTALGDGSLKYPVPIRRSDEMQEVFHTFNEVVGRLRAEQQRRVERLGDLIARVQGKLDAEELGILCALRDEHLRSLRP